MALSQAVKEEIIKTWLKNATKGQIETYLQFLDEYDLNPYMNHVVFMERSIKDKRTGAYRVVVDLYITHKGLLHIAHRSGQFDGLDHEYVYDDQGNVVAITAMVYRKDMKNPVKARASMKEYNTGRNAWKDFPETMLEVRAEAKALRKAFDIGINAIEEMERVLEEEAATVTEEATPKNVDKQLKAMLREIVQRSVNKPQGQWYNKFPQALFGKNWQEMTQEEKIQMVGFLRTVLDAFDNGTLADISTVTVEDLKALLEEDVEL